MRGSWAGASSSWEEILGPGFGGCAHNSYKTQITLLNIERLISSVQ